MKEDLAMSNADVWVNFKIHVVSKLFNDASTVVYLHPFMF